MSVQQKEIPAVAAVKGDGPPCAHCGSTERPMCFRGERFCSDNCRKDLGLDIGGGYNGRTA